MSQMSFFPSVLHQKALGHLDMATDDVVEQYGLTMTYERSPTIGHVKIPLESSYVLMSIKRSAMCLVCKTKMFAQEVAQYPHGCHSCGASERSGFDDLKGQYPAYTISLGKMSFQSLYGKQAAAQRVVNGAPICVLVEGYKDVWALASLGIPSMAFVTQTSLRKELYQNGILVAISGVVPLVLLGDGDAAGRHVAKTQAPSSLPLIRSTFPDNEDAASMYLKDPNLLKEFVFSHIK